MFERPELKMELARLSDLATVQLLARYPELAVPMKSVPDEKNGYLQWLMFFERHQAGGKSERNDGASPKVDVSSRWGDLPEIPASFKSSQKSPVPWDEIAARKWMDENRTLMDEVRAIGLLPDQSVRGIPGYRRLRFQSHSVNYPVDCLMAEARLAAVDGDLDKALQAVTSARGLMDHLSLIEISTPRGLMVAAALKQRIAKRVMEDIMPSLTRVKIEPEQWETALRMRAGTRSEFTRMISGFWYWDMNQLLLPILFSLQKNDEIPDPGSLLDTVTSFYLEGLRICETNPSFSGPQTVPAFPDTSHFPPGQDDVEMLCTGLEISVRNWNKQQTILTMYEAAFAVMKGLPPPDDPISGLPYLWDPATRELTVPHHHSREKFPSRVKVPEIR